MPLLKARPWYAAENSQRLTSVSFIFIAAIATVDAFTVPVMGLEFLYLIPILVAAAFISTRQVLVIAAICTAFVEAFSFPYTEAWLLRVLIVFLAFAFAALLVRSLVIYRRAAFRRISELEQEVSLLEETVEESNLLVNASPIGILSISSEGNIVSSNREAHEIFAVGPGGLTGHAIRAFLPEFAQESGSGVAEMPARRASGEKFCARVWSSKIAGKTEGATIAVIVSVADEPDYRNHRQP